MDLRIPVAVWHAPPSHAAAIMSVSKDGQYVVTADPESHQGVLWHVKTLASLAPSPVAEPSVAAPSSTPVTPLGAPPGPKTAEPLCLLCANSGAIVATGFGVNENGDALVATVHDTGAVVFWLARDGQALAVLPSELPPLKLSKPRSALLSTWAAGGFHSVHGRVVLTVDSKQRTGVLTGFRYGMLSFSHRIFIHNHYYGFGRALSRRCADFCLLVKSFMHLATVASRNMCPVLPLIKHQNTDSRNTRLLPPLVLFTTECASFYNYTSWRCCFSVWRPSSSTSGRFRCQHFLLLQHPCTVLAHSVLPSLHRALWWAVFLSPGRVVRASTCCRCVCAEVDAVSLMNPCVV